MCGTTYRRITETPDQTKTESLSPDESLSGGVAGGASASRETSNQDVCVDEKMHHYTRVQILTQVNLASEIDQSNDLTKSNDNSNDVTKRFIGFGFGGGSTSSKRGLWNCCHCRNIYNLILCRERCSTCGHRRCSSCSKTYPS